ncbi:MAG: hypothetical protein Q4C45_00750 [Oscillospiraceae bacterium]|nr:hypothetical protein [Oscillospiraceae bacterium]
MDMISVCFLHPTGDRRLTLRLPRDTRFSQLTALLYEQGFMERQKPGYLYLYQDHMCGASHTLGDYIPADAAEMELKLFQFPVVLL